MTAGGCWSTLEQLGLDKQTVENSQTTRPHHHSNEALWVDKLTSQLLVSPHHDADS
jgi:hypothetical protein